ncbi:MAG: DUF2442 domain-containing protein, partial [Clostridium sp.]
GEAMVYPKIKSIEVLDEYKMKVLFNNNISKLVDFKEKLKEEFYIDLSNEILFKLATVDVGGYGISWNDDIDISEHELWNIGSEI